MLSLASFYKGWDGHQQRLAEAIAPLTKEQLALSLPHHWSVGKIAAHIIAARVWWLYSRAGEGSADLAPLEHWDAAGAPLRSACELVRGLEQTWETIANVLAQWTPEDLLQVLPAHLYDPTERTRQWIIWHLVEHDVFHGGELSCILGAHGLSPVALE
jgi:uncharacterized damage-inducible protein DinB